MQDLKLVPTPKEWLACVKSDFSSFLQDHALCEQKAMATALSLIARFPERTPMVEPMICLAKEELEHYHQVFRLLRARRIPLKAKAADHYVKQLRKYIRHPEDHYLLDRLLVSALIEARSAERLELISQNLAEDSLIDFYQTLARVEKGHWRVFYRLACLFFPQESPKRLQELTAIEGECMLATPLGPRVH